MTAMRRGRDHNLQLLYEVRTINGACVTRLPPPLSGRQYLHPLCICSLGSILILRLMSMYCGMLLQ